MEKSVRSVFFAFVIISVLLSGCASSTIPLPDTNKSFSIDNPDPTNIPIATSTPIPPTSSLVPSETPTATKLPPTATLTSSVTSTAIKLPPTATLTSSVTSTATNLPPTATLFPSKTVTLTAESTSTLKPTNTSSLSGFTVLFLTSPVFIGSNATLKIQTLANTRCDLKYITPSGTGSEAAGLGETTANAEGVCSWTWKIGPKTKPGTGSLIITANDSTEYLDIVIQ